MTELSVGFVQLKGLLGGKAARFDTVKACRSRSPPARPWPWSVNKPTSALNVSVQGLIFNLLCDLQRDLVVSYLSITHNIAVVR